LRGAWECALMDETSFRCIPGAIGSKRRRNSELSIPLEKCWRIM
jgi:hypothetical protein